MPESPPERRPNDLQPAQTNTAPPAELSPAPFEMTSPDHPGSGDGPERSDDAGPAPVHSRTRTVVLGGMLVVALAGAGVVGTAGYRISQQKDATLQTPPQAAGLTRDDTENARSTIEYLRDALAAEVDVDEATGAVYSDPARPESSVLFFGGTTLIWTPEADLDTALKLISDESGTLSSLRTVDAGDLGGTMKCGTSASPDGDMAVCGWADHGSLALAMFPGRPAPEAAALLRSLRGTVQIRD